MTRSVSRDQPVVRLLLHSGRALFRGRGRAEAEVRVRVRAVLGNSTVEGEYEIVVMTRQKTNLAKD